jgi:uncharacterized OsmC-like protein
MAATAQTYIVDASIEGRGVAAAHCRRATIRFDSSTGRSEQLPGPAELFAASFAACVIENVEHFAELLHIIYWGAAVHVEMERQDAPPRFTALHYTLRIATNEERRRIDLLHRNVQKYGTVFNTVAAACDVSGRVVIESIGDFRPEVNYP